MNRQKGTGEPEFNRETYKRVKKYDRQQFSNFCLDIYRLGRADERKEVAAMIEEAKQEVPEPEQVNVDELLTAISQVKGIGPRSFTGVKEVVEAFFEGAKQ